MNILAYCGLYPYWGRYPVDVADRLDCTVGGGEMHLLQISAGLRDLGHEVDVCHIGLSGEWRGVRFHYKADFDQIARKRDFDAVLAWSDQRALQSPSVRSAKCKLFVQQLNDLGTSFFNHVDGVVSPSWAHYRWMQYQSKMYQSDKIPPGYITWSGVTCKYPMAVVWPREPIVGYWSSPDRGLMYLLKVWPAIKRAVPKARLWIFYEIKKWLNFIDACYGRWVMMHGWYRHQAEIVKRLLSDIAFGYDVEMFGALPRRRLVEYQQRCSIWCYPLNNGGDFVEGFCCAFLEAIAAGCWPIASPVDALPEIYGDAECDWIPKGDVEALEDRIIKRLLDPPGHEKIEKNFALSGKYTWEQSARQMESAIKQTLILKGMNACSQWRL